MMRLMEMQIVVKVVRQGEDGRLYSAVVWHTSLSQEYIPDVECHSPHGPLMAFQDLAFAAHFLVRADPGLGPFQVWRALATGVRPGTVMVSAVGLCPPDHIKRFWQNGGVGPFLTDYVPDGTVLCDTITLVERVE